jgi:hypothetical protein
MTPEFVFTARVLLWMTIAAACAFIFGPRTGVEPW